MIDSETFGFLTSDIARMSRAMLERRFAAAGLGITPGEARALLYIAAQEGERQARIAERMGIEPMTACAYVDKLEKRGLIARLPDPQDRRAKQVVTTDAAKPLVDALITETAVLREQILAGLSATDRDIVMKALRQVRGNLQVLTSQQAGEAETP
ncbi:MarR family winged helix-turn-helix transcriptional regulator [Oricola thermophila]|uniref:MarR family transcriptional regulator n=1 Tax=Oricola thermophila TaxID=2742145 RepID=A0A6N1VGB8_9HYPH|nr:MarR family transcriptional regulator [Oricola thermophila]QKV19931.1 MarR family transcriptional regulator [Oricola thermophila]